MLVQFLIATTVMWLFVIRWNNRHKRKLAAQMKNNLKYWPVFGHVLYFLGSDLDRMTAICEIGKESIRCGGSTCLWFINRLVVFMTDPADVEVVLKTCLEKDDALNVTHSLLGHGSIFAPVSIWRPRRKILNPHFNLKKLFSFMDVNSRQSQVLADRLKSSVGAGAFTFWQYIADYAMDTIGETVFGTTLDAQKNSKHPFSQAFMKHNELQAGRLLLPWLRNDFFYKFMPSSSLYFKLENFMNNFVNQLIIEKRKSLNGLNKNRKEGPQDMQENRPKSMIESFIEANEYTDTEMHEETLVLALAGIDTSAVGASFVVSLLSRSQHIQEKLYQELQEYYGDSDRPVTGDDLPHLKYLDAVLKEVMRLYPPVPVIARKVKEQITLPSGKTLIPGVGVYISIWGIHRNPQYWGPDAKEFRPERFLEGELSHPAAFMPFSRGPRNCIGFQFATMSMKTALIHLLRKYKFLVPTEDESKKIRVRYDVMLKHVDNCRVQIEARK